MNTTSRSCPSCHQAMSVQQIEPVNGEDNPLAVTLRGLPVFACANGHRQFLHPEFAFQVLRHLTDDDEPKLPVSNEKGLIFKHFLCADCGAEPRPKPDHRHTFSVAVALPGFPAFDIDLTIPVYRCDACGMEQLHSLKEIRGHTPAALVAAFRAAGIPHA